MVTVFKLPAWSGLLLLLLLLLLLAGLSTTLLCQAAANLNHAAEAAFQQTRASSHKFLHQHLPAGFYGVGL
jgi:hypothetical protein